MLEDQENSKPTRSITLPLWTGFESDQCDRSTVLKQSWREESSKPQITAPFLASNSSYLAPLRSIQTCNFSRCKMTLIKTGGLKIKYSKERKTRTLRNLTVKRKGSLGPWCDSLKDGICDNCGSQMLVCFRAPWRAG